MGRIYNRECDNCYQLYKGRGQRFCSRSCKTSYYNKIDNPAWRESVKQKISEYRKGKSTGSGKDHWNWQGKSLPMHCQDCGAQLKSIGWGNKRNTKYCTACRYKGSRHPNWKGGTTPQRHKEYGTVEYKTFVNEVLKRDSYTCQWCGLTSGHGITVRLEVHHLKSYVEHPELRFNIDNGITLCRECHLTTIRGHPMPKKVDKGPVTHQQDNLFEEFEV